MWVTVRYVSRGRVVRVRVAPGRVAGLVGQLESSETATTVEVVNRH